MGQSNRKSKKFDKGGIKNGGCCTGDPKEPAAPVLEDDQKVKMWQEEPDECSAPSSPNDMTYCPSMSSKSTPSTKVLANSPDHLTKLTDVVYQYSLESGEEDIETRVCSSKRPSLTCDRKKGNKSLKLSSPLQPEMTRKANNGYNQAGFKLQRFAKSVLDSSS